MIPASFIMASSRRSAQRLLVLKQPVGVVAAIAPWNFPSAMVARKVAPALASGCAIVFKPTAETPLSALALAILAERAGVPKGLFSVLPPSNARMFGEEVCSNPIVKKLTFTGSTEVSRILSAPGRSGDHEAEPGTRWQRAVHCVRRRGPR